MGKTVINKPTSFLTVKSATASNATCKYVMIGDIVIGFFRIDSTSATSRTFTNLPKMPSNNFNYGVACAARNTTSGGAGTLDAYPDGTNGLKINCNANITYVGAFMYLSGSY